MVESKHKKIGPWEFISYSFAKRVVSAERRLNWFDSAILNSLRKTMKQKKVSLYWDETNNSSEQRGKHTIRVTAFYKFDQDIPFNEQISQMQQLIADIQ